MCPITRWGSDLCFSFKPFITLDKKVTNDFPDSFFRNSERGKSTQSRTAVCLAIASLTRRTGARICTHTLFGKKRERHSWEVVRIEPPKVPSLGSESPVGISSVPYITQPFTTIETAVHQGCVKKVSEQIEYCATKAIISRLLDSFVLGTTLFSL